MQKNSSALIVVPSDLTGGAERIQFVACEGLVALGWQVDVIILSERTSASIWDEANKAVRLRKFQTLRESIGAIKFFLSLILGGSRKKYDIVFSSHIHCNLMVSLFVFCGVLISKNVFLRESTNVFRAISGWKLTLAKLAYSLYLKRAIIICQTDAMKDELIENVPKFSLRRMKCVPNPVDLPRLSLRSTLPPTGYNLNNDLKVRRKLIVSVGRLVWEKGFEDFIRSTEYLPNDFHLLIVGSGPLKRELSQLVFKLRLRSRISFLKYQDNPFPLMKFADCCVVSSRLEGFPNVLLEKMALGKRIVSTICADGIENIPGIYKCAPRDPNDLANAIVRSFKADNETLLNQRQHRLDYLRDRNKDRFVSRMFFDH